MTNILATSKVINGLNCTVTQKSKYPLPWTGKKTDRPIDYFEQIETSIRYIENERAVEIIIPAVEKDQNRKRKLQVCVEGSTDFLNTAARGVLDMDRTFDLPEMAKLLKIFSTESTESQSYRACLPFFYSGEANYKLPPEKRAFSSSSDGHLSSSHGDLKN